MPLSVLGCKEFDAGKGYSLPLSVSEPRLRLLVFCSS
jgi:hypothetical protein